MPFVLPRMNVLSQLVALTQGLCSAILVQGKHLPPVVWYFNLCSVHVRVLYILAESNTLEKKGKGEGHTFINFGSVHAAFISSEDSLK